MGILLLFVLDRLVAMITGRGRPDASGVSDYSHGRLSSYMGAIREKARGTIFAQVPDELRYSRDQSDEILEIRSCRRKADWTPPRTVRYQNFFYRLEGFAEGRGPLPYRYTLRRLAVGVMGRTVLVYSSEEKPNLTKG